MNVVNGAKGQSDGEEVVEEFDDTAIGTVTDECEAEDDLANPRLRDGQSEEDLLIELLRRERVVNRRSGEGGLLADELATDVVLIGEFGDGLLSSECLECEVPTLLEVQ
jgi:hypothetical protein